MPYVHTHNADACMTAEGVAGGAGADRARCIECVARCTGGAGADSAGCIDGVARCTDGAGGACCTDGADRPVAVDATCGDGVVNADARSDADLWL